MSFRASYSLFLYSAQLNANLSQSNHFPRFVLSASVIYFQLLIFGAGRIFSLIRYLIGPDAASYSIILIATGNLFILIITNSIRSFAFIIEFMIMFAYFFHLCFLIRLGFYFLASLNFSLILVSPLLTLK